MDKIVVRGAKVHNLKNIDVNIPLNRMVAIAGVSGSGKSSLALGVLYAEGSRRYLEALSSYTRRRMSFSEKAQVDEVLHVPPALALRQRPSATSIRSTFGTGSELLNVLRLLFSRCAQHVCPNGHPQPPSLAAAREEALLCPVCGLSFQAPSAEMLAFNGEGACVHCDGTGITRVVNIAALVPDQNLTIDEGAVAPWNSLMWSLMVDVCRKMGVRTDIPFKELSEQEKNIVYYGPPEKKHILYRSKNSDDFAELDFTYYNAIYTVENALAKVKDEKGMKRVEKFLVQKECLHCQATRLSDAARAPKVRGISLDQVCRMTLRESVEWMKGVPASLPSELRLMAESIVEAYLQSSARLLDLGLAYLTLDRAAATLSTGERQRMQLARAVRNRSTGILYVLDEPSIGLHPHNIQGLLAVMRDLLRDGNSLTVVDHDIHVLKEADYFIEMGPVAGKGGGQVIAQGSLEDILRSPASQIAPYFKEATPLLRKACNRKDLFKKGTIYLSCDAVHTVKALEVKIPKGCLSVVTGVSGSGKTTFVLESLFPALAAESEGRPLPPHIRSLSAAGIRRAKLIDASPIGVNIRSTVATYANIHDELRKVFAKSEDAVVSGLKAGDFSYNTGSLRCSACDGTGSLQLDIQFLPDVVIPCPECRGSRYGEKASRIRYKGYSLPELMADEVSTVMDKLDIKPVLSRLRVLQELGLGYLTLAEETPALSGGEAQRLKLASELGKAQEDSLFIFDEPSIGLHPLDVEVLLRVFDMLLAKGATLVVIEHDREIIRNADYVIDMGPLGGEEGGRIVALGTPEEIKHNPASLTGRYL